MITFDPKEIKTGVFHQHMLSTVAPRPIAFASTVDKHGHPNLSPFSFFNAFGSKPPTLVFSPARRVRDNTTKHTLENVYETMEVVINVVNFDMVQQASLSSCEYPKGVNEFEKAGFTQVPASRVKPFRVKESPVQFECKVDRVIEMGEEGGAANLIVCEILLMHVSESVLDDEGKIDPLKMDLVGRCGRNWYVRANGQSMFEVPKPNQQLGIGIDSMPESIRNSEILSGNDLGQLGNVERLPEKASIEAFSKSQEINELIKSLPADPKIRMQVLHLAAKELIKAKLVDDAWKILLMD